MDPRDIVNEKLRIIDEVKDNLRKGKETLCPKCGLRINLISGLIEGDPNHSTCKCRYMNYREIF